MILIIILNSTVGFGKFHLLHEVINWCKSLSLTPDDCFCLVLSTIYIMLQSASFRVLCVCVCLQLFCSTAAATFRQAVALVFDQVVLAESLPAGKFGYGGQLSRTNSVTGDVNRSINLSEYAFPFLTQLQITIPSWVSFSCTVSVKSFILSAHYNKGTKSAFKRF